MKKTFILEGLDCANCAAKIERKIEGIPGVSGVSVSFLTKKMQLESGLGNMDEILPAVFKLVNKFGSGIKIKEA